MTNRERAEAEVPESMRWCRRPEFAEAYARLRARLRQEAEERSKVGVPPWPPGAIGRLLHPEGN